MEPKIERVSQTVSTGLESRVTDLPTHPHYHRCANFSAWSQSKLFHDGFIANVNWTFPRSACRGKSSTGIAKKETEIDFYEIRRKDSQFIKIHTWRHSSNPPTKAQYIHHTQE